MLWRIIFIVLLIVQEIQILFIYRHIDKITAIFETIVRGKIISIVEQHKDGTSNTVYTNERKANKDDDAGF